MNDFYIDLQELIIVRGVVILLINLFGHTAVMFVILKYLLRTVARLNVLNFYRRIKSGKIH